MLSFNILAPSQRRCVNYTRRLIMKGFGCVVSSPRMVVLPSRIEFHLLVSRATWRSTFVSEAPIVALQVVLMHRLRLREGLLSDSEIVRV